MRADPQNQAAPLSYLAETKSYRFGRFVVDRRSACLRCDGVVLPLRPKSFDVLVYLVQNPGRLVPKGELIDNVWQDVMVTDNSLVQFSASRTSVRRSTTTPMRKSKLSPNAAIFLHRR